MMQHPQVRDVGSEEIRIGEGGLFASGQEAVFTAPNAPRLAPPRGKNQGFGAEKGLQDDGNERE